MRVDLNILQQWIEENSRVLDLGCGDGTLLHSLNQSHHIEGYGLEIDHDQITACIAKGVNVIETDINKGLAHFATNSFDTVLMTYSLQTLKRPDKTIDDMLRIGKECIVTFPNFGNLRARSHLFFHGEMPVTKQLEWQWYDTPNIHFCTVRDFEALCRQKSIRILDRQVVCENILDRQLMKFWPNLFGETAIYHLSK
jgi:methionine biosynthesis protein MetW